MFVFGAGSTSSSATSTALGQSLSGTVSSSTPFQFGAVSSSTTAPSFQVASTTAPAPSPFNLGADAAAPVKTTAAAPQFGFMANVAAPVSTPAAPFTFGANTASTASTGTASTFQFTPSGAGAKPSAPSGSAPLFQFGAPNVLSVTSSTTQPAQQTFGITSTPVSSASETVKPFAFNAGSTAQGFSFAPSKPAEATTGAASPFAFSGLVAKPDGTFPGFGASQPSSNQQASAPVSIFNLSSLLIELLLMGGSSWVEFLFIAVCSSHSRFKITMIVIIVV